MAILIAPSPTTRRAGPGSLRILVADDHATIGAALGALVVHLGHRVDVVGDGHAALEAATYRDYDIILMDVQMPVMDGLEATRRLRSSGTHPHRPLIIGLSADDSREDQASCLEAGMDEFLSKPVRFADLTGILNRWFSSRAHPVQDGIGPETAAPDPRHPGESG